jgi:hypothetical protein
MYFNTDRAIKYSWGLVRLGFVGLFAFEVIPLLMVDAPAVTTLRLGFYLSSGRWLTHAYIGSIGAAVNVQINSFSKNIQMLGLAALLVAWDMRLDYSVVVYLIKTFGADFLAGKLDTAEWRLVLLFTFFVAAPLVWFVEGSAVYLTCSGYSRVLPLLFMIQLVCELGDNHLEHYKFFRHRYSFEVLTIGLLFGLVVFPSQPLMPDEARVIQHDLVVCLFYRISNASLILARWGNWSLMTVARKLAFKLYGCTLVTDVETATAVLKASGVKGHALEKFLAQPAWYPVISLESIDGPLYQEMIQNFHKVLALLPSVSALTVIAREGLQDLVKLGRSIDADAICEWTVRSFASFVFGPQRKKQRESSFVRVMVDASWQWRKEIAIRGKADMSVKLRAVQAMLDELRVCDHLWPLFGESWAQPQFYSLLLQPFFLSTAINFSDIAVAVKRHPGLSSEEAMRRMHPFPILERWVGKEPALFPDGSVAMASSQQVIMFTSDFASSSLSWPVFGTGPRSCAGSAFALPLVRLLRTELLPLGIFNPESNHLYSGRNNDSSWTMSELVYFCKTVFSVFFRKKSRTYRD